MPNRFTLSSRRRLRTRPRVPRRCCLFGLKIENATIQEAADTLIAAARTGIRRRVYFVNAHCVNVAARDATYSRVLEEADLLYADGSGMAIAARLAGTPLRDNVNGTDLFPALCERAAAAGVPLALLGAKPGIAQRCAEKMQANYPGLSIVWHRDGFFAADEVQSLIASMNASGAKILLVARGVPLQETWIAKYAPHIDIPVVLGVGALFDFYSGAVPRSPAWMRKAGLEWAFRLALEPKRLFARYVLGNPIFLARLFMRWSRGGYALRKQRLSP